MKTIFELGEKDHALTLLPECDVPEVMPGAARGTVPDGRTAISPLLRRTYLSE